MNYTKSKGTKLIIFYVFYYILPLSMFLRLLTPLFSVWWSYYIVVCNSVLLCHLFPALAQSQGELEIGNRGSIYTTQIGNPYTTVSLFC